MASPAVLALVATANKSLKGKPPIGGTILCVLWGDGEIFIDGKGPTNQIAASEGISFGDAKDADCTISLSLAELTALEGGDSVTWAVITGKVKIEGDEGLAKKFGALVQGAQA